MDMYNMIEDVTVICSVPLTPYGTPSTTEVPDAIEPDLEEHDVMRLENHGAWAAVSYTHLDVYKRQWRSCPPGMELPWTAYGLPFTKRIGFLPWRQPGRYRRRGTGCSCSRWWP